MIEIVLFGVTLTVASAIGSFLLGRLTFYANVIQSVALKKLLYMVVALAGVLVVLTPGLIIALAYFDDLPPLTSSSSPNYLSTPTFSVFYLLYWGIIYLSFRMGTGRVHGHG